MLAAGLLPCSLGWAQVAPRPAANALPTAPQQVFGKPIGYQVSGNTAQITQTDNASIVQWQRFDIGAAASVKIVQPSANAVLLNKVDGGLGQNRTVIDGALSANGRVYLYNPNGIVFGRSATVDVATLIASSLKFDEARVIGGLLLPGSGGQLEADRSLGRVPGAVQAEGDPTGRARLSAAPGGLLLLAGPTVRNAGVLSAPDGQVMLAAGSKVYLAAPKAELTGTAMRGLLVEVSNDYAAQLLDASVRNGVGSSLAENSAGGRIDVGHGSATLIGQAVNQNGLVSAATSVALNGSVYLLARDQASRSSSSQPYVASRTGALVLGPDSVTQVLADDAKGATLTDPTLFNRSVVTLDGADIRLQARAQIVAPGGQVQLNARRQQPADGQEHPVDARLDPVRVDLAEGSVIDVSGSHDLQLPMASNVITVDLRGTELADNLALRNSTLYGSRVRIDIRQGTAAANVAGWLALVPSRLGQLNAAGGTVAVTAEGAVIQRPGSRIAVDGGWVDVQAGVVNTTQLQRGDVRVDIGSAQSGVAYTAAVDLPDSQARVEAGYRQGASAGTLSLSAPVLVLQGTLSGQAQVGTRQRDVAAADHPQGGQLQIGNANGTLDASSGKAKVSAASQFGYQGQLRVGPAAPVVEAAALPAPGAAFDPADARQQALAAGLTLDTAALVQQGFSRITALTMGDIAVKAPVTLPAGGRLWLGAAMGSPYSTVLPQPGGHITLSAPVTVPGGGFAATASGSLTVDDGVALNLAGRWVNDQVLAVPAPSRGADGLPDSAVVLRGGSALLSAAQLSLGDQASIDVSAGAWLSALGKTGTGSAGSITLQAAPTGGALLPEAASLRLGSATLLKGYGFSSGGRLSLTGRNVQIGTAPLPVTGSDTAALPDLALTPDFFQQGGFTSFTVAANVNLSVQAGTVLAPQAQTWRLNADAAQTGSGEMAAAGQPLWLDLAGASGSRPATQLTLSAATAGLASAGHLRVARGAQLTLDPGATLSLQAGRLLEVEGALSAPGGQVLLGLTADGTAPFFAERSVWLGSAARVSVDGTAARLFAAGDGVSSGELLDGGSIRIGVVGKDASGVAGLQPLRGFVVTEPGALLSANGADGGLRSFRLGSGVGGGVTTPQAVASAGGSIEIRASEGLLLAGRMTAAAGAATATGGSLTVALQGDNQGGEAGVLTLSPRPAVSGVLPVGLQAGQAIVQQQGGSTDIPGPWLLTGERADLRPRTIGQGWLPATGFADGGFARLNFKAQDRIDLAMGQGDWRLSAAAGLTLDAPTLRADAAGAGATLRLQAPYLQLGSADGLRQAPAAAEGGPARLLAQAGTLDLIGNSTLQGFGDVHLSAEQDVRLIGLAYSDAKNQPDGTARGALSMVGQLTLSAAQVAPSTLSDFTLRVADLASQIGSGQLTILGNGHSAEPVLSAAGSISALASRIDQNGRLVAPFGQISLGNNDAANGEPLTQRLQFGPDSVTSVVGVGVVPMGTVINPSVPTASDWRVQLYGGGPVLLRQTTTDETNQLQRALPAKAISAQGQQITVAAGAVLDTAGGGSLMATTFTPGKGGSKDVLANNSPGSATTVFAINPNFHGRVAPADGDYASDGGLQPGDSVQLSGMPGLAAGTYTLLPAHYALLPGGMSISLAPNSRDMQPGANRQLDDGTLLVAGRLAQPGAGTAASRSNGFVIAPQAVVRSQSEFALFDATPYFTAKAQTAGLAAPELPNDGGHVQLDGRANGAQALLLDGQIRLTAANGGRAGELAVSAPDIRIGNGGPALADAVTLDAGRLSALQADRLLIGGITGADGQLRVGARSLTLANDSAHPLAAADLVLTANTLLRVDSGANMQGQGVPGRAPVDLSLDAGSVVLRLNQAGAASVTRNAAALAPGAAARLVVSEAATLSATGAALLDGTGPVSLGSPLRVDAGGSVSLSAPGIRLGDGAPNDTLTPALTLSNAALAAWGDAGQVSLNSQGQTIGFYGTVQLGSAALKTLTLAGAGVQGLPGADGAAPSARVQAELLRLVGSAAASDSLPDTALAGSQLRVRARTLALGGQPFALRGFADAAFTIDQDVRATGSGGGLTASRDLTLSAGRFTADDGADAAVQATSALRLTTSCASPACAVAPPAGLGGQLSFSAAQLTSDALIELPSGQLSLNATDTLAVTGGRLSVAGRAVNFAGTAVAAPAGTLSLSGAQIALAGPAVLDLSATGADAGTLRISALSPTLNAAGTGNGSSRLTLNSTLLAHAAPGADGGLPAQGQFELDIDRLPGGAFGALNKQLNDAGFSEARSLRIRHGDVTLAGHDSIVARQLLVSVDDGNLTLAGDSLIDASGPSGGRIALYAAQADSTGPAGQLKLTERAQLIARGTATNPGQAGTAGQGGSVVLGSSNADGSAPEGFDGAASLQLSGGRIDVGGSRPGRNGDVTLRAPRVAGGSDVAMTPLRTDILNSAATVVEAVQVYTTRTVSEQLDTPTNLDATVNGLLYADAQRLGDAADQVLARLTGDGSRPLASRPVLRAGVEIRSLANDPNGALTVSVNELATDPGLRGWDLNAWRFGGEPIALTLRAAGHLSMLGSISDGFVAPADPALAMPDWSLDSTASASLRLAGGADMSAANPLAVRRGAGDVRVDFAARTPTTDAPLSPTDAPVALLRTGSGRIDIAAGRDITLALAPFFTTNNTGDPSTDGQPAVYDGILNGGRFLISQFGASVYTAGRAATLHTDSANGFSAPLNPLNYQYGGSGLTSAAFGQGGGALTLIAGRDVVGPHTLDPQAWYRNNDGKPPVAAPDPQDGSAAGVAQAGTAGSVSFLPRTLAPLVNVWLFRQGRSSTTAQAEPTFEVLADGRTVNTAWWTRPDYFNQAAATLGGGDLRISAGRHVVDLAASAATSAYASAPGQLTELGGGDLTVRAGGSILGGAFYAQTGTATLRAGVDIAAGPASQVRDPDQLQTPPAPLAPIVAMGDTRFELMAGRQLTLTGAYNPTQAAQSQSNVYTGGTFSPIFGNGAGTRWDTQDTSDGALAFRQRYEQFSSFSTYGPRSALRLTAAGGDLTLLNDSNAIANAGGTDLPNQLPSDFEAVYRLAPAQLQAAALAGRLQQANGLLMSPAADSQMALLAAGNLALNTGYTGATRMLDTAPASGSSAAAPRLFAQTDLDVMAGTSANIDAHSPDGLHRGDSRPAQIVSLLGDVTGDKTVAQTLVLPKALFVSAGRDIRDLGVVLQHNGDDTSTLQAARDIVNSTQAVGAAAAPSPVAQLVGGGGQVVWQAGRHIDLGNSAGLVTRGNLDNPFLPDGGASITLLAGGALPDYAAWQRLSPLPTGADTSLEGLNTAFFRSLVSASKASTLTRFDALIGALLPLAPEAAGGASGGDISLFGSQIKTEQGGAVNLFAPAGSVYAGLTLGSSGKKPSEQGLFTIRGGAIRALVAKDFLVNQGRVFTLGGGDITLVSQFADIDAGRGAKTASSAPPPLIKIEPNGKVTIDVSSSIFGSGIATLKTRSDVPAGGVFPIAPRGIFDAGDAGVRSSGDIDIVARVVLNGANIAASGTVSGAPTAVAAPAVATAPAATPAPPKTDDAGRGAASTAASATALSVELLCYGPADADGGDASTCDPETDANGNKRKKRNP
jgi:filamentous hemagglutinin family protein